MSKATIQTEENRRGTTAELLELMAEIRVMVAAINRMIEALEPPGPDESAPVDAEGGS